jgi:hypothetical protein
MNLRWKSSLLVSALHAAELVARVQPLADREFIESVQSAADGIQETAIDLSRLAGQKSTDRFWEQLLSQACDVEDTRELAERVVTAILGPSGKEPPSISILARQASDAEAAFRLRYPKFADQSELRLMPMRTMWETYGPGLLAHIGRMTDKSLIVGTASVVAMQPMLNGYGAADLERNRIRIEAVLTNPIPELPEAIRIAWLLSQLNLDLPALSETIHSSRIVPLAGLAMLPPALAASKVVELADIDESFVDLAIEQWQIKVPESDSVASTLLSWWETYLQTRAPWAVAMTALERMLTGS